MIRKTPEKPHTQETQERIVFKDRLLPALPEQYREPSLGNDKITPHGAAPANPFKDEAVKAQQRIIAKANLLLYETPPEDMPKEFVYNVVTADFVINTERRKMDNFEAYSKFLSLESVVDPSLSESQKRFERAHASIAEIIDLTLHTDIESAELGGVAHPYGYRMQELIPLRKETDAAIESRGGVVYPTIAPYRSIVIQPAVESFDDGTQYGGQRIIGFVVKYKRDYGHIPVPGDDTKVLRVVERQIAAYRVDEASGFDQSVLQAMHALRDQCPDRIHWGIRTPNDPKSKVEAENRLLRTGCSLFIEKAVQTDSLADFVVPLETRIYVYKDEVMKQPKPSAAEKMGWAATERSLTAAFDVIAPVIKD
jgi:hypothetical protein